jgi:hypothetical protein
VATVNIMVETTANQIPGYDFASARTPQSPVTIDELRKLEAAVGWTDEDAQWLRVAAKTLVPKAEEMVDHWRAAIAKLPHLVAPFLKPDGKPDDDYRAAVKRRFVQWVSDMCLRPHDQDWLNYQQEIGKRHTPAGKNKTDGAHTPPVVPLRYTIGFAAVVIASVRSFLLSSGRTEEELQRIQDAWMRAVLLSIALWARPYSTPDLW